MSPLRTFKLTLPPIVCLCGSVRFDEAFKATREAETLEGRIVVGPEVMRTELSHSTGAVKTNLDALHLRKIDLADEVFVISAQGYIGESTFKEIQYAQRHQKPIRWLEPAAEERFNGMAQREAALRRHAGEDASSEQPSVGLAPHRRDEGKDSSRPIVSRGREAPEARTSEAGQERLEVDR